LSDALGPVIAVGVVGLSEEHAANAASAAMLNSVRAWSNIGYSPVKMIRSATHPERNPGSRVGAAFSSDCDEPLSGRATVAPDTHIHKGLVVLPVTEARG